MQWKALAAVAAFTVISLPATAQVALHQFQAGERARAADVNGNFNALNNALAAAQASNTALRNELRDLRTALSDLIALNNSLSIETVNGVRTVRLSGVNLQIVNGLDNTESRNGAGNVIIGYDEPNIATKIMCSLATAAGTGAFLTNEAACVGAGGVVLTRQKTGSHNLVLGSQNSYSSFAGIIGGRESFITAPYAASISGIGNLASGSFAVNVSGTGNHATGLTAATLAGNSNTASGSNASVSGGTGNIASSVGTTVSGGSTGIASGPQSNISGGIRNQSSGPFSHVSGGGNNISSGATTPVAGGSTNDAQAPTSSISGGSRNVTTAVTQVLP